jgi:hypothetical protein
MNKPFRLTVPVPSEDDLHESVAKALDTLLMPPAVWTTFPAGGYLLSAKAAARLYRLGMKKSIPDILLWYRLPYAIELKKPGGKLSKTTVVRNKRTGRIRIAVGQTERHAELRAAGVIIGVCYSVDEVLACVAGWGLPVRRWM